MKRSDRWLPSPSCLLVLGAALCWTVPAFAVDLPRYDIAAFCGERTGTVSEQGRCRQAEQDKREALSAQWAGLPEKRRHVCVQKLQFQKKAQRSYDALHACVAENVTS